MAGNLWEFKIFGIELESIRGVYKTGGKYEENSVEFNIPLLIGNSMARQDVTYNGIDIDQAISNAKNLLDDEKQGKIEAFKDKIHDAISDVVKNELTDIEQKLTYKGEKYPFHIKKYQGIDGQTKEFIGCRENLLYYDAQNKAYSVNNISPQMTKKFATALCGFIANLESPSMQLGSDPKNIKEALKGVIKNCNEKFEGYHNKTEACQAFTEAEQTASENVLSAAQKYAEGYNQQYSEFNSVKAELSGKNDLQKTSVSKILKNSTQENLTLNMPNDLDQKEKASKYNKIEKNINKAAKDLAKGHTKQFFQSATNAASEKVDKSLVEKYYVQRFSDILNKYVSQYKDPLNVLDGHHLTKKKLVDLGEKINGVDSSANVDQVIEKYCNQQGKTFPEYARDGYNKTNFTQVDKNDITPPSLKEKSQDGINKLLGKTGGYDVNPEEKSPSFISKAISAIKNVFSSENKTVDMELKKFTQISNSETISTHEGSKNNEPDQTKQGEEISPELASQATGIGTNMLDNKDLQQGPNAVAGNETHQETPAGMSI